MRTQHSGSRAMYQFNVLHTGGQIQNLQDFGVYIEYLCATHGAPHAEIDTGALWGVLKSLGVDCSNRHGVDESSPFKKVATFSADFIAAKPILTPFPDKYFGPLAGCQNAIVAYELSVDALHGAEINCQEQKTVIKFENRIKVPKRYWMELIGALSACSHIHHHQFLALIYESLAYRCNKGASYRSIV